MKRTYSIDTPDQARLKLARTEIEAVLKKHDLGGVCVLHTPGMSEFFYDMRPSYSCAWVDEAAGIVRMKSNGADYGGDVIAQLADQAATANMVHAFAMDLGKAAVMFFDIGKVVDRAARAEHSSGHYAPDKMEARRQ